MASFCAVGFPYFVYFSRCSILLWGLLEDEILFPLRMSLSSAQSLSVRDHVQQDRQLLEHRHDVAVVLGAALHVAGPPVLLHQLGHVFPRSVACRMQS